MALSRWSPVGELASLHSAMDKLFSDFFGAPFGENMMIEGRTSYLPLDIVDHGDSYQVKAAVPGFSPDEVEVTFADGVLSISAQHKQEKQTKQGSYLRRELSYGNYARSIQLPGDIKQGDIKASFESGMLTVHVPKAPAPKPVKIPITGKPVDKQLVGVSSEK